MKEIQEKLNDNRKNKPIAPPPPPQFPLPPPPIVDKLEVVVDSGEDIPRYSFQLPAPPTENEIEEINKNNSQSVEAPKIASVMVEHNYDNIVFSSAGDDSIKPAAVVLDVEKFSNEIFEDVCEEVIKCDHAAPSVPDVILQVISEYLADSHTHQDNGSHPTTAVAVVEVNAFKKEEPLIEAKVHSNGYHYDKEEETRSPQTTTTTVVVAPVKKSEVKPTIVSVVQPQSQAAETAAAQKTSQQKEAKLNRNRTRKTITKTFVVEGQTITQTIKKTVNLEEEERLRRLQEERKRDLIEHRRNLNEDKRKITDLTRKQENEKEALEQDFKDQREKLLREFDVKLAQISQ